MCRCVRGRWRRCLAVEAAEVACVARRDAMLDEKRGNFGGGEWVVQRAAGRALSFLLLLLTGWQQAMQAGNDSLVQDV